MKHDHRPHRNSPRLALLPLVFCATFALSAPFGHLLGAAGEVSPAPKEAANTKDHELAFDIHRLPFERLDFKAKKLLWTATASLAVEIVDQDVARKRLISAPQVFDATSPTLRLDVGSGFLGRDSLSEVWLAPGSAQALQRIQTETGKRRRQKIYRFAPKTVFATRITPTETQRDEQNPDLWKQKNETEYPLKSRGVVVTEPSALFLILTTAPDNWLDQPRVIHTFSKNELHRVRVTKGETRDLPVNYTEVSAGTERTVRESRTARVVLLEPLPRSNGEAGEMQLLGLEGNIQLYLDAETRIPLQISGRIPPAGQVHIKLTRFQPKASR